MGPKDYTSLFLKRTIRSCHTQIPCGTDDIQKDRIVRNPLIHKLSEISKAGRGGEEGRVREEGRKGRRDRGEEG